MREDGLYRCLTCGLEQDELPWEKDGTLAASFGICSSCGTTLGYEDATPGAVIRQRVRWLEGGSKRFRLMKEPDDWNLLEQLAKIPKEYPQGVRTT